jgi:hypothetical protein
MNPSFSNVKQSRFFNRKRIQISIGLLFVGSFTLYYFTIVRSHQSTVPHVHVALHQSMNNSFKKISIAHYTTTYGARTDSRSIVLNKDLTHICQVLDPEHYSLADSVIVSLVDLVRFPTLLNRSETYRRVYAAQLWLVHTEESPRNSYRSVKINNIEELDDWFNLTATLKPDSDFHIQYKVSILLQ